MHHGTPLDRTPRWPIDLPELAGLVVDEPAVHPRAPRCPYCLEPCDKVVVECASCEAVHHPGCFGEAGGCAIEGCEQQRGRGRILE